ncbi:class-II fumarase/aspartase family protein [Pseudomonas fontis]|uniref:Adenylosuccinate lyase family protein n=1 Tax=Pseudomonas fontis TaxID=2942633 RepID=A0ABT5NWE4_9PSED|nr:adenylosuccinate lyase family protein [Pseudomonas fontis]MDD0976230.1 adenylosuccinate lyase family protein [Pseudomonas fontis]MDD0992506.1 adenylosuccinate lyase family protein [Pseudomonas fontis]
MDSLTLEAVTRSSSTARSELGSVAECDVQCQHEHSHILDSKTHGGGYAGPVSRKIFCSHCRLQRWLDVEAALALAQADVNIIPRQAALDIAKAARLSAIDVCQLVEGVAATGHSLMPLLSALQKNCSPSAREFVHFGATTQDIQDTAQSLEMRDVLDAMDLALNTLLDKLAVLADAHRDSLMVARTHSIPALPTTFALKVAGWIDELMRHRERLAEARKRILVVQLFGGVGTMAAFGSDAMAMLEGFARRLDLDVPLAGWHVSRDRVAEFVSTLAMTTASLARVADEIRTLNRWEIGEVEVGWSDQQIGSSTMPHKRNPEGCEQVVVLARLAKAQVMLALDAMILEHERDYRGTRLEWCAVADVSHYALMALSLLTDTISGLIVNDERMECNAHAFGDAICTEAVVFEMATKLGKSSAYNIIFEVSQASQRDHVSIREAIECDARVMAVMEAGALARLFEPRSHLGMSETIVDSVLAKVGSRSY